MITPSTVPTFSALTAVARPAPAPRIIAPRRRSRRGGLRRHGRLQARGRGDRWRADARLRDDPAGGGPPPHRHLDEDELFILVAGREEYLLEGVWTAVEPGSVVYVPRGTVHTFRNVGDTPSRKWTLTTSGAFDRFFTACGEVFDAAAATRSAPDMGRILGLFAEHRLELIA
jgi:mannose-6-phosphate isomerase-like protein (cupin superfamily)